MEKVEQLAAAALIAAVIGFGLFGLSFYARLSSRLPTALDWAAVDAHLRHEALENEQPRVGDVVALAPVWAERARMMLPPSLPILALPGYASEDLVNVRRVWLLAIPNAPGDRLGRIEEDLLARAEHAEPGLKLGAFSLRRYDLAHPTLPLAWLPERIRSAHVAVGDTACRLDADDVFRCPPPTPDWVHVAREVREIDYQPRDCIYAHPSPNRASPLTLTFSDIPFGRSLRGHTGIRGEHMLVGNSVVSLAVSVDGEPLGTVEEPPGAPGWHLFQLDTSRYSGTRHTLRFQVTAEDVWQRLFCFEAMTLP